MRKMLSAVLLCGVFILGGCTSTSISNSGYESSPSYKGELTELDLFGIDLSQPADDATIAAILEQNKGTPIGVTSADSLLVVQSGAEIPDVMMTEKLGKIFHFSIMSGVPSVDCTKERGYPRYAGTKTVYCTPKAYGSALRLAAAQAGHNKIIVYWGILEQGNERNAGTAVSWIPLLGDVVPDKTNAMRIRMKVAIIDVKTGQWRILSPEIGGNTETNLSSGISRVSSHQSLVETLKDRAYEATVAAILKTGRP